MRGRSHGEGIEWPLPRLFMQRYRVSTRVEGTRFGTLCCRTARELNCERVVPYCSSDCNDWFFFSSSVSSLADNPAWKTQCRGMVAMI